ncbi:MAG: hypothetical protein WCV99_11155 [Sterolibacterium sp.]|jgi:hypothetical protein
MIRIGHKIRLTPKEALDFTERTGFKPPQTVREYNRLLQTTARNWLEDDSPETRLMAAVTEGGMLGEEREDTKTALTIFHEELMLALAEALISICVVNGKVCKPNKKEKAAFEEKTDFCYPRTLRQLKRYQNLVK